MVELNFISDFTNKEISENIEILKNLLYLHKLAD